MYSTELSSEKDLIDNFQKTKKIKIKGIIFASQIEGKIDEESSSIRSYNYRLNRVLTPKISLEEALYVY